MYVLVFTLVTRICISIILWHKQFSHPSVHLFCLHNVKSVLVFLWRLRWSLIKVCLKVFFSVFVALFFYLRNGDTINFSLMSNRHWYIVRFPRSICVFYTLYSSYIRCGDIIYEKSSFCELWKMHSVFRMQIWSMAVARWKTKTKSLHKLARADEHSIRPDWPLIWVRQIVLCVGPLSTRNLGRQPINDAYSGWSLHHMGTTHKVT